MSEVQLMMGAPLVSIVIPCYNHEEFIQTCLDSILNQEYPNIELIVIDDGSIDGSVEKISEYIPKCKKRFSKFEFRSRPNKGLCATLNEGIRMCSGEFYCAIASDDELLPKKLSVQVPYLMEHPNCVAVFGGANVVNDRNQILRQRVSKKGIYNFEDLILVKYSPITPSQLIRLDALRSAGPYPEHIYIEDWYMWLKLSKGGYELHDTGDILVNYRKHGTNMSNNGKKMHDARMQILQEYQHNPIYPKAVASAMLSAAIDKQPISKLDSLRQLRIASMLDSSVLLDKRFIRYLIKMFIPSKLLNRRLGRLVLETE